MKNWKHWEKLFTSVLTLDVYGVPGCSWVNGLWVPLRQGVQGWPWKLVVVFGRRRSWDSALGTGTVGTETKPSEPEPAPNIMYIHTTTCSGLDFTYIRLFHSSHSWFASILPCRPKLRIEPQVIGTKLAPILQVVKCRRKILVLLWYINIKYQLLIHISMCFGIKISISISTSNWLKISNINIKLT